jgi:hypothetical protein
MQQQEGGFADSSPMMGKLDAMSLAGTRRVSRLWPHDVAGVHETHYLAKYHQVKFILGQFPTFIPNFSVMLYREVTAAVVAAPTTFGQESRQFFL